jgi:ABC-type long-subunit fatty acid transport system fused permease/ATPase subunit
MATIVRTSMVATLFNTCRDSPSGYSLNNMAIITTIYKIFILYYVLEINQSTTNWLGIVVHTLIPALGRQKQVDLCEFNVSMVYKENSWTVRVL